MTTTVVRQAGVIAVRDIGQGLQFALVRGNGPERAWVLPKGHVEEGETIEEAALREAREELGVTGFLFGTRLTYPFTFVGPDGADELRIVTFFPMAVVDTVPTTEAREVVWHTTAHAVKATPFVALQEMIRVVRRML